MRTLLLLALLCSSAGAAESWVYTDAPGKDCSNPQLLVSPETKELDLGADLSCRIIGFAKEAKSATYQVKCNTDEPAEDVPMTVVITPQTDGTAIVDWSGGVGSARFEKCPEPAIM